MMKISHITSKLRVHKRATIAVATVTLVLLLVLVGMLWSQRVWADYTINYNQRFSSAKVAIDKVISQTVSKGETGQLDKINSISKVQTKLTNELVSYCDISPFFGWQRFIGQYSDKITDCERRKSYLSQLLADLGGTVAYLKAEQQLAVIISTANEKTNQKNQPENWGLIEAFWRQAITDVAKLPATTQFKTVKTLASTKLTVVAEAWKSLLTANEAKDRQQFQDASSNLSTAYTSLAEVGDNSSAEAKKLIDNLTKSYKKTFQG